MPPGGVYPSPHHTNTLAPMNHHFGAGQTSHGYGYGAADTYHGIPPPHLGQHQSYTVGPEPINTTSISATTSRGGPNMLPSSTTSGVSSSHPYPSAFTSQAHHSVGGGQVNLPPNHKNTNPGVGGPPTSVSNEGIPIESPATMAFNGLLASGSFAPNSAAWPHAENETTPITAQAGSKFSDEAS